jgi:hypothetical protein
VELVKTVVHADRLEHATRVGCIPIGEDETAAGQPLERTGKLFVGANSIERNGVNVG